MSDPTPNPSPNEKHVWRGVQKKRGNAAEEVRLLIGLFLVLLTGSVVVHAVLDAVLP